MPDSDKLPAQPPAASDASAPARRRREVKAPEVRRSELLQAAAALFEEKGVAATAIGDITERAQVAKGTFYIYFASKDALIAEIWKDYVAGFMTVADEAEAADRSQGPQPQKLLQLIERLTHHALDNTELHRLIYSSADAAALVLCKQSDERILARLLASMGENLVGHASRTSGHELQASLIFHALDGALHRAIMAGERIDRAAFVDAIRQFASNALGLEKASP
ncbi:TetR/AcrR family transcriptional regulator [Ottowia flava]|uniref:TetR/AcrR family transcriptional regulator n=1 Tax=Ottowia flava TaxID=2675430 RepID=A0ABW4KSQ7_9BURK|nr:TetR/AcrR family transcriptional regulator [Ottowia sp. GY511]